MGTAGGQREGGDSEGMGTLLRWDTKGSWGWSHHGDYGKGDTEGWDTKGVGMGTLWEWGQPGNRDAVGMGHKGSLGWGQPGDGVTMVTGRLWERGH